VRDLSAAFITAELTALPERESPRTGEKMGGRTVGIFHAIL
jgi:hypothetical protein